MKRTAGVKFVDRNPVGVGVMQQDREGPGIKVAYKKALDIYEDNHAKTRLKAL